MKKITISILLVLVMSILAGCGMKEEDAKAYVQASLDASYKGEFDAFVEITDSTPEGAKAMYEENIVHIMEEAGFSDLGLGEELTEKYRQLFLNLIKKVDYTVGDAVKNEDDSFSVEINVRPITIMKDIQDELQTALLKRIEKMDKYPSEKKIVKMGYEEMYNILSDRLENPTFSEDTVNVTINLHKNEEGKYAISEEDMYTLDSKMFETNQ